MKIPLFPLDVVLFPGATLPLHIFEDRYKEMVGVCIEQQELFGVVFARVEGLSVIGCTARIVKVLQRYPDGRLDILCEGVDRFEIEGLDNSRTYLQAEVDEFKDEGAASTRTDREQCTALHFELMELIGAHADEERERGSVHFAYDLDKPVSFRMASALPVDLNFKQELLSTRSDAERTRKLIAFYDAVLPKLRGEARVPQMAARNGHVN